MLTASGGMMVCPRCHGSTWDPDGGDCRVCGATGALTTKGEWVDYDEASRFIRRMDENRSRRL
jgi:hypothetical protein